jgi:hypothetical protein
MTRIDSTPVITDFTKKTSRVRLEISLRVYIDFISDTLLPAEEIEARTAAALHMIDKVLAGYSDSKDTPPLA